MIYMTPQASRLKDKPRQYWGHIFTVRSGSGCDPDARAWCADNQIFTGYFDSSIFFSWLESMSGFQDTCKFVVCPDSVGNAIETLDRFRHYAWQIKAMGFPVAFVAQDGQESLPLKSPVVLFGHSLFLVSPQNALPRRADNRDYVKDKTIAVSG